MTNQHPLIITLIQLGSFGVLSFLIYWAVAKAHPQILGLMRDMLKDFRAEQDRNRAEFAETLKLIQDRTDARADKVVDAIEQLRSELREEIRAVGLRDPEDKNEA